MLVCNFYRTGVLRLAVFLSVLNRSGTILLHTHTLNFLCRSFGPVSPRADFRWVLLRVVHRSAFVCRCVCCHWVLFRNGLQSVCVRFQLATCLQRLRTDGSFPRLFLKILKWGWV
jgi:hypothetical protein